MDTFFQRIVIDGLIISLIASVWLMFIMWVNPRIFLHDYPAGIQAKVSPKTKQEKQLSYWLGIPFILILIMGPLLSTFANEELVGANFWMLWLFAAGLIFIFNLIDWLVLDWLFFCTITPKIMVIPGSEGMQEYKDYRFHFIGFLKGMVFTIVGGLLIAGIVYLI